MEYHLFLLINLFLWYNLPMLEKIEKLLKAIKAQVVLPSISLPKVETPKLKTPGTKMLGIIQPTKKNPVNVAQQVQNKDIKDIKLKEAQEHLKINKSTGQWSI